MSKSSTGKNQVPDRKARVGLDGALPWKASQQCPRVCTEVEPTGEEEPRPTAGGEPWTVRSERKATPGGRSRRTRWKVVCMDCVPRGVEGNKKKIVRQTWPSGFKM